MGTLGKHRQGRDKEKDMDYQTLTTLIVVLFMKNAFLGLVFLSMVTGF